MSASKASWEGDSPRAIVDAIARKAAQASRAMKDSGRVDVELTMGFEGGRPAIRTFRIDCTRATNKIAKDKEHELTSEVSVSMSSSPMATKYGTRTEPDIVTLGGLLNTNSESEQQTTSSVAPKKEWREPDIVTLGGMMDSDEEKSEKDSKTKNRTDQSKTSESSETEPESCANTSDLFPQATLKFP